MANTNKVVSGSPSLGHMGARPIGQLGLGIALLALGLRLPGLWTAFWFDEIWTYEIAQDLASPLDLFTQVRHSNNHHLNTFWFWLIGEPGHYAWYRVHSLLAGTGSVALVWQILRDRGRDVALIGATGLATSYLAIHFSSEARGYAMAVFFALACWRILGREIQGKAGGWLFGLCAVLGFLSHLLFLHAFVGLALWYAWQRWEQSEDFTRTLKHSLRRFAGPTAFVIAFYLFDIRHITIGKAPPYSMLDVLINTVSYYGGGPASGIGAWAVTAVVVAALGAAIVWLWRHRRAEALLHLTAILLSPALVILLLRPDVMFVRYFLVGAAFAVIAVSEPLAVLLRKGGAAKAVAALLMGAYLLGNGIHYFGFLRDGRGDYAAALSYIREHSTRRPITVTSNHHFRGYKIVEFYESRVPQENRVTYVRDKPAPQWYIRHQLGSLGEVPEAIGQDTKYHWVATFPFSDLSGWNWLLYQRTDAANQDGPRTR